VSDEITRKGALEAAFWGRFALEANQPPFHPVQGATDGK
jgi:hypothetical protein